MKNKRNDSEDRRYDERPGHFSPFEEDMLNGRLDDIKFAYLQFKESKITDTRHDWPFFLNTAIAEMVCLLFINDIKEFKKIHHADGGTDDLKRSAYIARWIAKLRPIEFDRTFPEPDPSNIQNPGLAFLNEEFAIFVFFNFLKNYKNDTLDVHRDFAKALSKQLKYIFSQREPERDMLLALACATSFAIAAQRSA